MLSKENSIPQLSQSYLSGQDIFWSQFNEVNFYIEDTEQENLYLVILSKLFKDLRFLKIFPLNGKQNVINEAKINSGNRSKIYIVDKDFDDLHNIIINIDNLFYLDRYCIENYLYEIDALVELVIEEAPTYKKEAILAKYSFKDVIERLENELAYLFALLFIVQTYDIEIKNTSYSIARFTDDRNKFILSSKKIDEYKYQVKLALMEKGLLFNLEEKIKLIVDIWTNSGTISNNIGGKHMLFMIIIDIIREFRINKTPLHDSYCYRLAKSSEFHNLYNLKSEVLGYLNN